jgi:hypothetical protein
MANFEFLSRGARERDFNERLHSYKKSLLNGYFNSRSLNVLTSLRKPAALQYECFYVYSYSYFVAQYLTKCSFVKVLEPENSF